MFAVGLGAKPRRGHAEIFSFSSGNAAASASFTASGSLLTVTLTNVSKADTLVPSDVLTGLFFSIAGNPNLTAVAATVPSGSYVFTTNGKTATTLGTTDVGNQWAYRSGISGAPGGGTYGLGAAGFNIFGPHNLIESGSAPSPGGVDYGVVSAGDSNVTGNGGLQGRPLIDHSVQFTFTGLPVGTDLTTALSDVVFQYGTSCSEPNYPGGPPQGPQQPPPPPPTSSVPEPATPLAVGLALLVLGLYFSARPGCAARSLASSFCPASGIQ